MCNSFGKNGTHYLNEQDDRLTCMQPRNLYRLLQFWILIGHHRFRLGLTVMDFCMGKAKDSNLYVDPILDPLLCVSILQTTQFPNSRCGTAIDLTDTHSGYYKGQGSKDQIND